MTVLLDLIDQARLSQAVIEKTLLQTEEVKCGGDMGREPVEGARNLLDFHVATLELKRLAGDLHRIAEDLLVANMGDQRRATIDGTTVEIRRSYSRKWDQGMITGAIAACVLQGERIPEVDVVVSAITKALYKSTQWSTTELKNMGIDPDKGIAIDEETGKADGAGIYCSRELSRASVAIL